MSKSRLSALGLLAGLLVAIGVALSVSPAYAWHATVSGASECIDGHAKITWSVQNSEANSTMTITASNNAAVPVGTTVAGGQTGQYVQSDLAAGDYSLDIAVSWSGSDETNNPEAVTVTVPAGCTPPTEPPTPTPTPTPTPPVPTPPVPTPPAPTPPPTSPPPVPDTGA